jgi:trimeric autotransporter adhesin
MNYYEIRSTAGALDLAGWTSIDGNIPATTTTWEKAGGSTAGLLSETNLQGMKSLAPAGSTALGHAYAGTTPQQQDLQFFYGTTDAVGTLYHGFVEYVTSTALLGDYNGNGVVDAADYTKWRDTLGQNVAMGSGADGDNSGKIDAGDYTVWKNNFGEHNGSGSLSAESQAVPEPTSAMLLLAIVACLRLRQFHR